MPEHQAQQPATGSPGQPGTSEAARWADHPFAGTWEAAIDRVEEVAAQAASRFGSGPPSPGAVDAAVCILATLPGFRDASVSTDPAVVWDIDGETVAVYRHGTPDGPVTGTWCTCVNWGSSPCEHVLVALAGTEQHAGEASDPVATAAFGGVAAAIAACNPGLTHAERRRATLAVLEDTAIQIRTGNLVIVSRPDKTERATRDADEFPRVVRSLPDQTAISGRSCDGS
jgi:hypothetical protein